MSPYKSFISAAKTYLESIPLLKFLLNSYIYVFSLGGLLFLLGSFIPIIYAPFTFIGGIIVYAGLLLTLVKEDMLTLVIASGSLSFVSLVAWIVGLIAYSWGPYMFFGSFRWQPFFFFLIFGAVAVIVFVKSESFKQMRAQAAVRNMTNCARCGTSMPKTAGFCPNCGTPNPATQYAPPVPPYAPPAGPQSYAPPAGPYAPTTYQPYTPPAAPPYAPPAASPYAPPMPPPFVPAEQAVTAPPAAPAEPEEIVPPAAPAEPEEIVPPAAAVEPEEPAQTPYIPAEPALPAVKQCINCGAQLPAGAVFCGKCGTKQ